MKTNYMNETKVRNEVGRLFANEKISFYGWKIIDVTIKPTGNSALVELVNYDLQKEINIMVSTKLQPLFISKGIRNDSIFSTLREALNV